MLCVSAWLLEVRRQADPPSLLTGHAKKNGDESGSDAYMFIKVQDAYNFLSRVQTVEKPLPILDEKPLSRLDPTISRV